ncbi:MAG: protein kinase [Planctomycetota bacterium]
MTEEAHLIHKAITQDFFGPNPLADPERGGATAPKATPEIDPQIDPKIVPEKYQLLRFLGRGGFGVVYLAQDKVLDRQVALKFLTHARPADVERLRREARFTARLNDPCIIQIYELDENKGHPFIAIQYIPGESLASAQRPLPELIRAMRDIAQALERAHQNGIVHRDIKPENILLDPEGRAYLTDFGIARDVFGEAGSTLSQEGLVQGTPGLMPPEQARGENHRIDSRSDIYSFGATLYTLLAGQSPFSGQHAVDVLHAVIHEDPPFPRSLNPSIPRSLESVVIKCMKKEKNKRYQTMGEVLVELKRFLQGAPLERESSAWFRKLVGKQQDISEESPEADTDSEPHWATALEVAREIAAWDADLYRVRSNLPRTYPRLEAIIERLDGILAEHPDYAWARFYRGMALVRLGRMQEALDAMEISIDRVREQAGAQFELGRLYLALYLREVQEAYKHLNRIGREDHLAHARTRLDQAVVAFQEVQRLGQNIPFWQVDYAYAVARLADEDFAGCVEVCDGILERDCDVEEVWKLRGDAQRLAGEDALESYEKAAEIRRSYYEVHYAKAEVYFDRGDGQAARRALKRALEIQPQFIEAEVQIARSYLLEIRSGTITDAAQVEQSISHGRQQLQTTLKNHPDHYEANVTLGELLIEQGRIADDPAILETAMEKLRGAFNLMGCGNRVNNLISRARLERARQLKRRGGDPRPDLEAVLSFRDEVPDSVQDTPAWDEVLRAAEEELAQLDDD